MSDAALVRLLDLLAEERAAILAGRYGSLAAIGAAKPGALEGALSASRPGPGLARGLALLQHNQSLLAAALSGLRGAAQMSGRADSFMAYGKDGSRAAIDPAHPGFERRA